MAVERTKGAKGAARSELVAVRFDPRTKYLMDIAARVQRRSVSSFVEWAVEKNLDQVFLDQEGQRSVAGEAATLWAISEPARLAHLNRHYPLLLNVVEQKLVRAAKAVSELVSTPYTKVVDERERAEIEADQLRPYWDYLKQAAEDDLPLDDICAHALEMKRERDGFGPITKERLALARAKAKAEYEKKLAFIDEVEKSGTSGKA